MTTAKGNTPDCSNIDCEKIDPNLGIEIWRQVVAVQMHFNDVCLKIRSFGVAAVGVILTASGFSSDKVTMYTMLGSPLTSVQVFLLAALVVWAACFIADRFWYHQLLLAAVKHGKKIEKALKPSIPEVALTNSISEYFPAKRSANSNSIFYFVVAMALLIGFKIAAG